jgi:hypothetical protein
MKKYTEILNEIKAARASMKDTAKAEKELERAAVLEARKNGTPEEYEKARAAYKAAEQRYMDECLHNDNIKIKIEILKDNAAQALFAETINTICDIWNKYEGKPHGEKTAQKIRDELKAATGHSVYISERWRGALIRIYGGNGAPFHEIEICPVSVDNQPATDSNNKIVKIAAENMRVYCGHEYVENVDEHINAIREAHKAAKEAEKALENAIHIYNNLTRGNIQHASVREGVKIWLI